MNIDITARHAQLTDRLREHATERLAFALRHAEAVTSAHVIFDHERTRAIAEIVVRGRHLAAVVMADGDDHFLAVDRCADKLRHQLDHHVGRTKDRRRRAPSLRAVEAELAAHASAELPDVMPVVPSAGAAQPAASPAAAEEVSTIPSLVRTHVESLPLLALEAACASLDDGGLEFLVFRDASSSRVGVLYRRADGQIGLVETGAA